MQKAQEKYETFLMEPGLGLGWGQGFRGWHRLVKSEEFLDRGGWEGERCTHGPGASLEFGRRGPRGPGGPGGPGGPRGRLSEGPGLHHIHPYVHHSRVT